MPESRVPSRFTVIRDDSGLHVSWRWLHRRHVWLLIFSAIWNGTLVKFVIDGGVPALVLGSLHIVAGVGMILATIAGFVNRTTITASRDQLAITHAPIRLRANVMLRRNRIVQLDVVEVSHGTSHKPTWALWAVLASGQRERLIARFESHSDATFIKQVVADHYGLRDQPKEDEVPAYLDVTELGNTLQISWRWSDVTDYRAWLVLCVLVNGLLVAYFVGAPGLYVEGVGTGIAMGVGLIYAMLACYLNRTTITVSPDGLVVRHGPIPVLGNKTLPHDQVKQLYLDEITQQDRASTWDVRILLDNGKNRRLVGALDERRHAEFLERTIEDHMRIRDEGVAMGA